MIIYITNILLIGMLSIVYNMLNKTNKKINKRILVTIITFNLFIILAFRNYSIGIDVHNYLRIFQDIKFSNFDQFMSLRYELGFKLLVKVISFFTNNFRVFLIIISAISIVPIGRFIFKYSNMPFLSFMIYISFNFYYFTFSGLRQAIAFSIICISFDYIRERKPVKFIITVILASSFHISGIFFLPAYLISKLKVTKKTLLLILILNIFIFMSRVPIMRFITTVFFDNYTVAISNSFQWYFFNVAIYIICLVFYQSMIKKYPENNEFFMLVATGITLMLFASVAENAMRISDYYYIFSIILIPELLYSLRNKYNKVIMTFLFALLLILLSIWFLNVDTYGIVPYKF